ncbi:hypothetical protein [Chroococcidiopsis cubana]|nr:hypothetical protein [Chroococcidiopsis cubana]
MTTPVSGLEFVAGGEREIRTGKRGDVLARFIWGMTMNCPNRRLEN